VTDDTEGPGVEPEGERKQMKPKEQEWELMNETDPDGLGAVGALVDAFLGTLGLGDRWH